MTITELIAALQAIKAEHGDLSVVSLEGTTVEQIDAFVSDVFYWSPYGFFTRDADGGEPVSVLVLN